MKYLCYLVFPFILLSCANDEGDRVKIKKNKTVQNVSLDQFRNYGDMNPGICEQSLLQYEIATLRFKDEACTEDYEDCTHVSFDYPVFSGEGAREANITLRKLLSEFIGVSDFPKDEVFDLSVSAQKFVASFYDYRKSSENNFPWIAEAKLAGYNYYNGILALKIRTLFDMGRNHLGEYYYVLHFDEKTGELIQLRDHITDAESFQMLAENTFRNKLGYKNDEHLNMKGFDFPYESFVLPVNFSLTNKGIELLYNPGEIADDSMGPLTMLLTFDEMGPLFDLKNNYNEHLHEH